MLLELFKNNFDSEITAKKVSNQLEQLKPGKESKLYIVEGLEIIPYDVLWPEIIKKLKRR